MAEETPQPQQAGQAVPQPASVVRTPSTAEQTRPAPPGDDSNPLARAAALRREVARLEQAAGEGPATINVKIEPPHSELHFGGTYVGNEFVPVPRSRLSAIQQAADNAGVTLTTEG